MIRLSVTDLDQYLYWLSMEDEGPEWLIERLAVFEPSPAMAAGSALHGALERLTNSASLLKHDGYTFTFECDAEVCLPRLREFKIEREILPGVVLVGRVDGIDWNRIVDYKLTERLDAERYANSMQWRAYLSLFGLSQFEYSIFEGSPERGRELNYVIRSHHSLRFYSYSRMQSDVEECVSELARFVRDFNITTKML